MKRIKKILLLLTLSFFIQGYSQDSIVNYLDRKGKITVKGDAISVETIVKKDSLWLVRRYYPSGKIFSLGKFKNKTKKEPIGEYSQYYRSGKIKKIFFYNKKSLKSSWIKSWSHTGKLSYTGLYRKNKKEGIWKYYHFNGKIASKLYYKNDSIVKSLIYDEKGLKINTPLIKFKKAEFKGGISRFNKRLKSLVNSIDYKVTGKVFVNFIIDIDGEIINIEVENKLPNKLKKQIIAFFKEIKGWSAAIQMNRRFPVNFTIPLNFVK